jgi:2-polyprenyl-3-methyl-5-hydroxy-6-metoxy-1,4-benzoquinol methylase
MQNIYTDGTYLEKNPSYDVDDSPWKAKQILKMIRKNNLQPNSICEVGCGAGEILKQLQLNLPDSVSYQGYDISPQAIELSRQRENERLRFSCEDFILKDTQLFDIVLCIDVFEHVEDYLDFLRQLKPKSTYKIFHIPLDMSVQFVLRAEPILWMRKNVGHLHYFMKDTALSTLEDTGYKIVDYFYTPQHVDLAKTLKAQLLKLPRKILFAMHPDLVVRLLGGYSLLVLAE